MTASSATVLGEAVAKMPLLGSLPRAAAGVSAASWGALMAGMSAGVKREVSEAEVQVAGQRKAGPQPIAGGGIREARVAGGRPAAGKPGAPEEPRRAKTERSTGAQAVARTMAGPGAAQQTAAAAVAPEAVPIGTVPGAGLGAGPAGGPQGDRPERTRTEPAEGKWERKNLDGLVRGADAAEEDVVAERPAEAASVPGQRTRSGVPLVRPSEGAETWSRPQDPQGRSATGGIEADRREGAASPIRSGATAERLDGRGTTGVPAAATGVGNGAVVGGSAQVAHGRIAAAIGADPQVGAANPGHPAAMDAADRPTADGPWMSTHTIRNGAGNATGPWAREASQGKPLSPPSHRPPLAEVGLPAEANPPAGRGNETPTGPVQAGMGTPLRPDQGSSSVPSPVSAGRAGEREVFGALDSAGPAPIWVHTGNRRAEAGFEDPALGWVGVRAEAAGAQVHAAILPGSAEAARTLGEHLGGLTHYLEQRHAQVASLTVAAGDSGPAGRGSGQSRDDPQRQGDRGAMDPSEASAQDAGTSQPVDRSVDAVPQSEWTVPAIAGPGQLSGGRTISLMA
jgi:hypothetical protein